MGDYLPWPLVNMRAVESYCNQFQVYFPSQMSMLLSQDSVLNVLAMNMSGGCVQQTRLGNGERDDKPERETEKEHEEEKKSKTTTTKHF